MEPLTSEDPRSVGSYQLRARLGSGGMGRVYLGFSPAGRAMAIKVIHAELAGNREFRARFRHEAAAARKVSGLFTAPVVAAEVDGDPPWLATAFVPGPSLGELVSANGPLPEPALWQLAGGLAEALTDVHASGVVHRDLKPTNVLLAVDGPRVIDFGISRTLDGTVMTASGLVVGTPAFMSPEQAKGVPVGKASDIFSFGCLLAYAATGNPPFGDGSPATILYRIVHAQPALDGMGGRFAELVTACLAKSPGDRPDLSQLAEAIASNAPLDPATSPASFWTDAVAELIYAYQDRYKATVDGRELSHAKPRLWEGEDEPTQTGPTPTAPGIVAPDGPGSAPSRDLPGPAVPARATAQVTRRRVILGLAGATAAAAAAVGWELSGGGTSGRKGTSILRAAATGSPSARSAGSLVWKFQTGGQVEADLTVSKGVVYVGSHDHKVYALRASDSARLWAYPTGDIVYGGAAVTDGTVYVGSGDTHLYALDARSGTRIWDFPTDDTVASDPATAAGIVYAGSDDGHVYALRVRDGSKLWAFPTDGEVFGQVVSGGVIYAGGGRYMYALRARDGTMIWNFRAGGQVYLAALADGVLFFGSSDHHVYALRAGDGARLWSYPTGGEIHSAPSVAAGVMYIGSDDFSVYALAAHDGTKLWEFPAHGKVDSAVSANGVVYAGSGDYNLYALRARDGSKLWDFPTDGSVYTRPAIVNGVVYFGSYDHYVYAVRT